MLQPALTAAKPKPRRGRPPGSVKPLTRWLRGVIAEMRNDGYGQAEVWRRICLIEDVADDGRSFVVTAETADSVWHDVGAELASERVTFESFRKTWRRTG